MDVKSKLKDNEKTKAVYVNDFLSRESLELFNYAKSLKSVGYKFIYTNGNKIYAKMSSITRPRIIRNQEDVDDILLQATTNNFHARRSMGRQPTPGDDTDDNETDVQVQFLSPDQQP